MELFLLYPDLSGSDGSVWVKMILDPVGRPMKCDSPVRESFVNPLKVQAWSSVYLCQSY